MAEDKGNGHPIGRGRFGIPGHGEGLALGNSIGGIWREKRSPSGIGRLCIGEAGGGNSREDEDDLGAQHLGGITGNFWYRTMR